jgi:hypothetical protein
MVAVCLLTTLVGATSYGILATYHKPPDTPTPLPPPSPSVSTGSSSSGSLSATTTPITDGSGLDVSGAIGVQSGSDLTLYPTTDYSYSFTGPKYLLNAGGYFTADLLNLSITSPSAINGSYSFNTILLDQYDNPVSGAATPNAGGSLVGTYNAGTGLYSDILNYKITSGTYALPAEAYALQQNISITFDPVVAGQSYNLDFPNGSSTDPVVPEPSTLTIWGLILLVFGGAGWLRRRGAKA